MDTDKSSLPPEWSGEASAMLHPAPPVYRQQGWGPQVQPQGYGVPLQYHEGSGEPNPGGYGQPNPAHSGALAVTNQPTLCVTRAPLSPPVKDYLAYSIFTLLCCCMPLGVGALVFSISARNSSLAGERAAAEGSAQTARKLNHMALGVGLGLLVLYIIFFATSMSLTVNRMH